MAEAATDAEMERQEDEGGEAMASAAAPSDAEEIPEMLDLIDAVEENGNDPAELVSVIRNIVRRIRATPGDRELLSDFEGIPQICKVLSEQSWRGEAMLAFCRAMPEICKQSAVNRGGLRDAGFVGAVVDLLRTAVDDGDEAIAVAAALALSSTCTANDGNKKAAARLCEEVAAPEGGEAAAPEAPKKAGALITLLDALGRFPESLQLQAEAMSALRALLTDDDPRKSSCQPAALDNREVALSDAGFPFFGLAVERALSVIEASETPVTKLHEQTLLLLRELSRHPERAQTLALDAKLLQRVQAGVDVADARVVRAALAVLRNFAMNEEVRDELVLLSDGAQRCISAVRKHSVTPAVCEAGFGLFANLTMRRSPATGRLCDCDPGLVPLGVAVLRQHRERPDVNRSTVQALRNAASQEEAAAKEVKESGVFDEIRSLVLQHETDPKWKGAVDISRQLLREFRADEGMEKKAQYNKYY